MKVETSVALDKLKNSGGVVWYMDWKSYLNERKHIFSGNRCNQLTHGLNW